MMEAEQDEEDGDEKLVESSLPDQNQRNQYCDLSDDEALPLHFRHRAIFGDAPEKIEDVADRHRRPQVAAHRSIMRTKIDAFIEKLVGKNRARRKIHRDDLAEEDQKG